MAEKTKLGDIQISLRAMIGVFTGVCSLLATVFLGLNFYFAPRHVVIKEISAVQQDVTTVKSDVKAIKKIFDEAVEKGIEDGRREMERRHRRGRGQ